jgi:hypothetical protein
LLKPATLNIRSVPGGNKSPGAQHVHKVSTGRLLPSDNHNQGDNTWAQDSFYVGAHQLDLQLGPAMTCLFFVALQLALGSAVVEFLLAGGNSSGASVFVFASSANGNSFNVASSPWDGTVTQAYAVAWSHGGQRWVSESANRARSHFNTVQRDSTEYTAPQHTAALPSAPTLRNSILHFTVPL